MQKQKEMLFYPGLIFLICIGLKIIPATFPSLTPDACCYLDIARNIANCKGAITSYNLYQYWPGVYYPALAYTHCLFSIVIAPIYAIFRTVEAVNLFNVFISGINAILLYFLLCRRYKTAVAFWAALTVSIAPGMQETAMYPWTEQLFILVLLSSISAILYSFEKESTPKIFFSGVIIGVIFLVRAAGTFSVISLIAAALVYQLLVKKNIKQWWVLLSGALLIPVGYELFCLLQYHVFYPENFKAVNRYMLANSFGGGFYQAVKPVLQSTAANGHAAMLSDFFNHVIYIMTRLPGLTVFILPLGYFVFYRKNLLEISLFMVVVINIVGHAFNWAVNPIISSDTNRYLLVLVIGLIPLVFIFLYEILEALKKQLSAWYSPVIFGYAVALVFLPFLYNALTQNLYFSSRAALSEKQKIVALENDVFSWIQKNTNPDDIVATDYYQRVFALDRPVVPLPKGKMLTEINFKSYTQIYRPKCVLTISMDYSKFLTVAGYSVKFSRGLFNVWTKDSPNLS